MSLFCNHRSGDSSLREGKKMSPPEQFVNCYNYKLFSLQTAQLEQLKPFFKLPGQVD